MQFLFSYFYEDDVSMKFILIKMYFFGFLDLCP